MITMASMGTRVLVVALAGFMLIDDTKAATAPNIPTGGKDRKYWNDLAKSYMDRRFNQYKENHKIAKNVILFLGDGMGPTTVTAARILKGQLNNMPGEETVLKFEEFPHTASSKTYNVDRMTADSAGTATAIMTGVKTNYLVIGYDANVMDGDCVGSKGKELDGMLDWAMKAGKKTGIVTQARITHATPAATFAHVANRYWEGDYHTKNVTGGCKDIAAQLIDDNKDINVIFGGGRRYFLPNNVTDPETNTIDSKQRADGRNLIQEWQNHKKAQGSRYKYVWNKDEFDKIDPQYTDFAMGLFSPGHMAYELDRDKSGPTGEPSLPEMAKKAVQILGKKENGAGFFLLVEGARIDHGHHDNLARKALHETVMFEAALREILPLVDLEETLIIVTADHSHAFDITGYPYRGSDIFGLVQPVDPTEDTTDGKPYSILIYGNGPEYSTPRKNLSNVDMSGKDYTFPAAVPMPWETHGGEDVMIYAQGPMAYLFHGVHEQNYIGHVMAYSACIGPYHGKCPRPSEDTSSARTIHFSIFVTLGMAVTSIFATLFS